MISPASCSCVDLCQTSDIEAGVSLTRFEFIERGGVDESVDRSRPLATAASFGAWFSEDDPDESLVCNDVGMMALRPVARTAGR